MHCENQAPTGWAPWAGGEFWLVLRHSWEITRTQAGRAASRPSGNCVGPVISIQGMYRSTIEPLTLHSLGVMRKSTVSTQEKEFNSSRCSLSWCVISSGDSSCFSYSFFKKIFILVWLCRVLADACRIFNCGMWTLSCSMWNLGIKPGAPALGVWSLSHWATRKVPLFLLPDSKDLQLILEHSKVKVAQLCLIVCNPMDYTVHGILQAWILEWVPFTFSRGSSQLRDWTQVSHIAGGSFYQLSLKGHPRILEWVAYLFSSGSSWPRNRTGVSCIASGFFNNWAIGKHKKHSINECPVASIKATQGLENVDFLILTCTRWW